MYAPLWLVCPSPRPHRKTSVSVRLPSPAGRGGDFCSLRSRRVYRKIFQPSIQFFHIFSSIYKKLFFSVKIKNFLNRSGLSLFHYNKKISTPTGRLVAARCDIKVSYLPWIFSSTRFVCQKIPLLYIRSILAELKNQYKYNECFKLLFDYNWGKYSTVMIYKLNGRIIPPLLLHMTIFIFPVGWKKVSYPRY